MPNGAHTSVTIMKPKVSEKEFRDMILHPGGNHIRTDRLYAVSPETYLDIDGTNIMASLEKGRSLPTKLFAIVEDTFLAAIEANAVFTISKEAWETKAGKELHRRTIDVIGRKFWDRLLTKELEPMDIAKILDRFKAKHGTTDFLNGYDGNTDNLGTKGRFELLNLEFEGGAIHFCMDTAGEPPRGGLQKVADFTGGFITGSFEIEGYGKTEHIDDETECTEDEDCDGCDGIQNSHGFHVMPKGGEHEFK